MTMADFRPERRGRGTARGRSAARRRRANPAAVEATRASLRPEHQSRHPAPCRTLGGGGPGRGRAAGSAGPACSLGCGRAMPWPFIGHPAGAPGGLGRSERHDVARRARGHAARGHAAAARRDRIAASMPPAFVTCSTSGCPRLLAAAAGLARALGDDRDLSRLPRRLPGHAMSCAGTAPAAGDECARPARWNGTERRGAEPPAHAEPWLCRDRGSRRGHQSRHQVPISPSPAILPRACSRRGSSTSRITQLLKEDSHGRRRCASRLRACACHPAVPAHRSCDYPHQGGSMPKIDRMLVGEALVGDGNEIAHIDLIIGPRAGRPRPRSPTPWPTRRRARTACSPCSTPNLRSSRPP